MIEIRDLQTAEAEELMDEMRFGHLACALGGQPYVVPINFVFAKPDIFFYTTEGKKTKILDENPLVCLQIEDRDPNGCWRSVVVTGTAERITDAAERETAVKLILNDDIESLPAVGVRWENGWIRSGVEAVYRITPNEITGRFSTKLKVRSAFVVPGKPSVAN